MSILDTHLYSAEATGVSHPCTCSSTPSRRSGPRELKLRRVFKRSELGNPGISNGKTIRQRKTLFKDLLAQDPLRICQKPKDLKKLFRSLIPRAWQVQPSSLRESKQSRITQLNSGWVSARRSLARLRWGCLSWLTEGCRRGSKQWYLDPLK